MIVDHNGNPIKKTKPITREIAAPAIYDKYSTYPSNGLTPGRLASILKEADQGDVYRQMELFEEIEGKDPHLFSQMQTRKNSVSGVDFEILPYSEDEMDKKITKFISNIMADLDTEDIFMDLLDSIGKGFAVSEIIWKYKNGMVVVDEIKSREQKKFFWDHEDKFKVMTVENPNGEELPLNKFIIHRYKARSGHPSKAGIMRVISWMYLFKNYTVKDWVAFAEVYGMPLRLGKYNAGASDDDKQALQLALVMLGSDAAGIVPEGTEIEFIEASKVSSLNVYESLANFCNKEMSKAILGQTLTTDIGDNGSKAAAVVHDGVRHDLVEADCKALARTIRNDLIKPLVLFNFGSYYADRAPYVKFNYEEPEDVEKNAETYRTIIKDIGLPVAEEHLYEKLGIPKPEAGQKLVVVPQAPAYSFGLKDTQLIANKDANVDYQKEVDALAYDATSISIKLFNEMFKPFGVMIENSKSLEELQKKLNNPEELKKILKDMENEDMEELLQKSMFIADMYGRKLEYDRG